MNDSRPVTRRSFLRKSALLGAAVAGMPRGAQRLQAQSTPDTTRPIPVVLATDIGDDIDDTWALGLLLKSRELDLKLAIGDYGKREYRAKLLAKFLKTVGHGNVPVGMGVDVDPRGDGPQAPWVKDFELSSYPGKVHQDGIGTMIETIVNSRQPVTLIAIGPMP